MLITSKDTQSWDHGWLIGGGYSALGLIRIFKMDGCGVKGRTTTDGMACLVTGRPCVRCTMTGWDAMSRDRSTMCGWTVTRWDGMSRDRSAMCRCTVTGWGVMSRDRSTMCRCTMTGWMSCLVTGRPCVGELWPDGMACLVTGRPCVGVLWRDGCHVSWQVGHV